MSEKLKSRTFTPLDQAVLAWDQVMKSLFGGLAAAQRPNPAAKLEPDPRLSETERAHIAGLMRVNHTGEVCAQALYQSQALTARSEHLRDAMGRAAREEIDHLHWCEQRLRELGGRQSRLNPLWYAGSFAIGTVAGLVGDRWNLGFVAETERQVVRHLQSHLRELPARDARSRAIVVQMKSDEAQHATQATESGAADLPTPMKGLMNITAKCMTILAYRF